MSTKKKKTCCNRERNLKQRINILLAITTAICFLLAAYLFYCAGLIPGFNPEIDEKKASLQYQNKRLNTIEGTITDRNNTPLTQAEEEPGKTAKCLYPEETGWLIGYSSDVYGSSGLRNTYEKERCV